VTRALAIVDGEHYAPVVRDALAELPYEVTAAWVAGGTEKLRGGEDYGVPLVGELEDGLAGVDVVVDLSDEPVLGPRERFRLASRVLAAGLPYVGADFRFDPPTLAPFELPSLGIVGTGKRVGKTALAGAVARQLAGTRDVVVVAMGRGGPPEPELAEVAPTLESLLALSRAGRHAASDYLEDAALAQVVTVGCRRCGGGLAGATSTSNVLEGARLAAERTPDLVIFEGSGAALPPVATRKRVLVAGAGQPPEIVTGYLNTYRILISDLVVLMPAESGEPLEELRRAIHAVKDVPVVAAALRPRPIEPIEGRRIAFFTTTPEAAHERLASHLREVYGARTVAVSGNLARRPELRTDLGRFDADVYVVEIKAAAIDVVAEAASERGIPVVFADNEVVPLEGELDLEAEIEALAEAALQEPVTV
jgi:cyclic 2,3-diphosphoglycerate synthetase